MKKHIALPLSRQEALSLRAGEGVLLSGVLYTARDAAHKRLADLLQDGRPPPVDLRGQVIYYVGPAPARPGEPIGSAGPTTSGRMDAWAALLISQCAVRGMIGKGDRRAQVVDAMKKYSAVYFAAIGGAGALLASCVTQCEVVAYPDLGAEAIHRLVVKDFPAVVAIDCHGGNLYRQGPEAYLRSLQKSDRQAHPFAPGG
jgi:fumarate hydratase subunit beta